MTGVLIVMFVHGRIFWVIVQQVVVSVVFIENDLLLLGAWIYRIEPY